MVNAKKSTQDILQEEILRERAAVLARAGERLTEALDVLRKIEREIGEREAAWIHGPGMEGPSAPPQENEGRRQLVCEMNRKIHAYNHQLADVRKRYYYLIVTREALGVIHHQRLEEFYRIPPKKRCVPEF